MRILDCFGIMLGLSINYDKSAIIPINCEEQRVEQIKVYLGCLVTSLPIKYLDIPLGANPRHLETWKPIIEKIKKKLSG